MVLDREIRFKEAYIDGCKSFCFIVYALTNYDLVVYALSDDHEAHVSIREHIELENESLIGKKPNGGGVFNAETGYYERGSFSFGNPDPNILDTISWKLDHIVARKCSR